MHKPAQPIYRNKPFVLICLFTCSTLAASLMPAADGGEAAMGAALKLSAHCQPGRQA